MTITEFLSARLDEDEAVARDAPDSPWERGYIEDLEPNAHFVFGRPAAPGDPYSGHHIAGGYEDALEPIADYIAYFEPESMLADVAAKRAIVALHSEDAAACYWSHDSMAMHEPGEVCDTLQALVQPYAEHPDFDPAWRV